jgi:hypothetical protein
MLAAALALTPAPQTPNRFGGDSTKVARTLPTLQASLVADIEAGA